VFRFVSVLGERYTHGHVFDFFRALRADPAYLRVLGDGRQEKSYLYVQDCVAAILTAVGAHAAQTGTAAVYNLGTEETITVDQSIATITSHLGLAPRIEHTGGERGWAGDSPRISLDCTRIRSLGWQPSLSIRDSVRRTLDWFGDNPYVWQQPALAT
jgi:UDP-glucose 4-epimerase